MYCTCIFFVLLSATTLAEFLAGVRPVSLAGALIPLPSYVAFKSKTLHIRPEVWVKKKKLLKTHSPAPFLPLHMWN